MTAPIADATMERGIAVFEALIAAEERDVGELLAAFVDVAETPERWAWARAHPEAAADSLKLGGRVRQAFLIVMSGEGARAPAGFHGGGHAFWRY